MTKDEALALALEALEAISQSTFNAKVISDKAIAAIKQAQQAQEPVESGFFSKEAMMAHHILKDRGIAPKQAKPAQG